MKRSIFFCLPFVVFGMIFLFSPLQTFADSNITYNLNVGVQSLSGNNFPIDLTLLAPIDESQVQIQWILPPGVNTIPGELTNYQTSLIGNKLFKDHFVISPQYPGRYYINASITTVVNGVQQIKNLTVTVNLDQSLHLKENNDIYTIYHSVYLVWYTVCFIALVLLLIEVYFYLYTKFFNWLNREG